MVYIYTLSSMVRYECIDYLLLIVYGEVRMYRLSFVNRDDDDVDGHIDHDDDDDDDDVSNNLPSSVLCHMRRRNSAEVRRKNMIFQ